MANDPVKTPANITLGWLENLYFTAGNDAVQDAIRSAVPKELLSDFLIVHRDEGIASMRVDIKEADKIQYVSFSPPAYWGAPITVLKMDLDSTPVKTSYVCHGGEELVIPITGSIRYNFYWSPGKAPLKPCSVAFPPDRLATINPSLPHHGWSDIDGTSSAWLILYHNPESSAALNVASNLRNAKIKSDRRRIKQDDLKDPGEYALVAWDLADRIRTQRQRLDLTIQELAGLANIDPSHVSRLESASANYSLETLIRICDVLRIDLRGLLTAKRWSSESVVLSRHAIMGCAWAKSGHPHKVHPRYFRIRKNDSTTLNSSLPYYPGYSAWIILEGQAILEFSSEGKEKFELVNGGDVIHFRADHRLAWRALKDTRLVSFHLGEICPLRQDGSGTK